MATIEEKLDALFDELVPVEGKCDSLAGEIVRAVSRIAYRWSNDGDRVNYGYGRETCNPAARFLCREAPEEVQAVADQLWASMKSDTEYEDTIDQLMAVTVKAIEDHPELREQETKDMFEFTDLDEDRDDSWDGEDDDSWDGEDDDCYDDEYDE